MERTYRTRRVTGTAVAMATGVVLLAGCGGSDDSDYANEPRPPTPIVVSASIGSDRVSVSPRRFGAGPVTLIVTNQTGQSREITLETDEIGGSSPGIEQNSGPINPGDTASLKADLARGTYRVAVDDRGIEGASLRVGAERASAQDELLQP
jgi:hypothetical protein